MRILMLNHFPLVGSGSGVYTLELARALKRLNHEVGLVYPDHYKVDQVLEEDLYHQTFYFQNDLEPERANAPEGIKAFQNTVPFNFPCFTSHPKSHNTFKALKEEEIEQYLHAMKRALDEAIDVFRPDILHIQHIWVGAYLAHQTGLPYVVTCHGTDLMGFSEDPRYREMALTGLKGAYKVIAVSEQVLEAAIKTYGLEHLGKDSPEQQAFVKILNGYSPKVFNLEPRPLPDFMEAYYKENPKAKWVTFTGKFTHFKGIDVLLRAAAVYEKADSNLYTLISGSGVLRETLEALTKELELKRVIFLGHQSPEDLTAIYQRASVHVVPSRTEPFGLVAVEALACGLPVVGTAAGGLLEIVNSRVGRLVPIDFPDALARAVLEMVVANAGRSMEKRCSDYAHQHFSWEKTARASMGLYEQAITNHLISGGAVHLDSEASII